MQGGKRPTKAEQDWQDWQRSKGCVNCGSPNPAIHHCVGSAAKHNKIHIGQFWTLPLCYECHQGPEGIHNGRGRFSEKDRKTAEKQLFFKLLNLHIREHIKDEPACPVSMEVIDAIQDYHK